MKFFPFLVDVRVIVAPIKVNDSRSDRSEISSREFSTGSVVVPNVRAENEELALTRRCSTSRLSKHGFPNKTNQILVIKFLLQPLPPPNHEKKIFPNCQQNWVLERKNGAKIISWFVCFTVLDFACLLSPTSDHKFCLN